MMSKQDKALALAAIALYNAGTQACVSFEGSDEDFAEAAMQATRLFLADFEAEPDDPQAIAVYVYSELQLDTSKIA